MSATAFLGGIRHLPLLRRPFFRGIREAMFAAQAVFSLASPGGVCCAGHFFAGIRVAVFNPAANDDDIHG
ncbi:hypothetical protein H3V53_41625 [Paraburkholderia bengalensis]|uniref:Uncharacterized protein n=1 Tax=Paraburkholderia bengalensis TaxID=2747562 RepID=A0ABU8J6J0_9BURK